MADDQLFIRTVTAVLNCTISQLVKKGALDFPDLIEHLQQRAISSREGGDTALANAVHAYSEALMRIINESEQPGPPRRSEP